MRGRADGEEQVRLSLNCTQEALTRVVAWLSQHGGLYEEMEILALEKVRVPRGSGGAGRAGLAAAAVGGSWPRPLAPGRLLG